jgi:hypothetical protein
MGAVTSRECERERERERERMRERERDTHVDALDAPLAYRGLGLMRFLPLPTDIGFFALPPPLSFLEKRALVVGAIARFGVPRVAVGVKQRLVA